MAQATPIERIRRRGRTLGVAIFSAIVASFTIVCTVQICLQVWAPEVVNQPVTCRPGIVALHDALEQARLAAAQQEGEQAALARFRALVAAPWKLEPAVARACASDREGSDALRELVRLRYAEEHAVRYEAPDLAARRRQVNELIPRLKAGGNLSRL
jgi:hypothetical protein